MLQSMVAPAAPSSPRSRRPLVPARDTRARGASRLTALGTLRRAAAPIRPDGALGFAIGTHAHRHDELSVRPRSMLSSTRSPGRAAAPWRRNPPQFCGSLAVDRPRPRSPLRSPARSAGEPSLTLADQDARGTGGQKSKAQPLHAAAPARSAGGAPPRSARAGRRRASSPRSRAHAQLRLAVVDHVLEQREHRRLACPACGCRRFRRSRLRSAGRRGGVGAASDVADHRLAPRARPPRTAPVREDREHDVEGGPREQHEDALPRRAAREGTRRDPRWARVLRARRAA